VAEPDNELGPEIADDEPCGRCGYILRGLREGHRCPECGTRIPFSFPPEPDEDLLRPFRRVAETQGLELDAVFFVFHAVTFASERAARAGRRGKRFSALEFGWCLRDFALEQFDTHDAARNKLEAWRIARSEDVGAILFGLVEAGVLKVEQDDCPSDFDGIFTLNSLFG
jgi:uncharacterized repeat protein (TIGR04138 family)